MRTIHIEDIRNARLGLETAARRLWKLEQNGPDVSHEAAELLRSSLSHARVAMEILEAAAR